MREIMSSATAKTSFPVVQSANSDDSKTQLSSFSLNLFLLILALSQSKQGAMDASTSSCPVSSAAAYRITGLGVIIATADWVGEDAGVGFGVPGRFTVVATDKPQTSEVAGTVTVAETITGFFLSRTLMPVILTATADQFQP